MHSSCLRPYFFLRNQNLDQSAEISQDDKQVLPVGARNIVKYYFFKRSKEQNT